jgi:hypothetical protein
MIDEIKRGLKEVVEAEVKRFLEHYSDCEVVDSIHVCWEFSIVKYDVMIYGLPCDVKRKFVVRDGDVIEFSDITCYVDLDDYPRDKTLGWVRVANIAGKCFVETHVDEVAVDKVAGMIVKEAEKEAEKEQ